MITILPVNNNHIGSAGHNNGRQYREYNKYGRLCINYRWCGISCFIILARYRVLIMRFSKTTGCFYPENIEYAALPDDIMEVPQAAYYAAGYLTNDQELAIVNGALVVVPKTVPLDELKLLKIAALTKSFDAAVKAGFTTTSGIKMNADISDVQRLKSAYDLSVLVGNSVLPFLTDYNNANHLDTPLADVLIMVKELGVNFQTLYSQKNSLRSQAMAATTQAQLDEITW